VETSIWQHVDLASIIVTAMFGVLLPSLVVFASKISARLRDLEGDFRRLDERCMTRCKGDQDFRQRNDKAHDRIEVGMGEEHSNTVRLFEKMEKKIEVARQERAEQIKTLEARLVREFRNGGKRQ